MKKCLAFFSLLLGVIMISACTVNPVTGKRQVVLMSGEQEIAMGKEADPQIIQQYGLYEDKVLQDFINQKGKEMAAISHRPGLTYNFRIVDSDILNAFAVPGGYVYFTRGIMAHFNNEAEFAGVLGHEIGHVTARHSVVQQRNALLGQLGILAGTVISPEFGKFAESASQGMQLLFLKFGRDDERESDQLGVEYSTKIGYNAHEMAGFFHTLERKSAESGAGELPAFLSTHPNPGDRNIRVNELATEWQGKLNVNEKSLKVNRDTYLRKIDGLVYGEDPRQGFVENGYFYHPVLKFLFSIPSGWNHQNTPAVFQMAPKDGNAMMMLSLAEGNSLEKAAGPSLQKFGLTAVQTKATTVNGLNALEVIADLNQEQGKLRSLSYFIQYQNAVYHLLGVTNLNLFNTYQPYFTASMRDFKELKDPAKLNRKPERVRIKTVASSGTLERVFQTLKVSSKRYEEFAVLNGMALTDKVPAGTLIKVVER